MFGGPRAFSEGLCHRKSAVEPVLEACSLMPWFRPLQDGVVTLQICTSEYEMRPVMSDFQDVWCTNIWFSCPIFFDPSYMYIVFGSAGAWKGRRDKWWGGSMFPSCTDMSLWGQWWPFLIWCFLTSLVYVAGAKVWPVLVGTVADLFSVNRLQIGQDLWLK